MPYPPGFNYVQGPFTQRYFLVASAATFVARDLVTLNAASTVDRAESISSTIVGVAMSNATASTPAGSILVGIPTDATVFANVVAVGTASAVSVGRTYGVERDSGTPDRLRVDEDSAATPMCVVVPRGDGTTVDSADSSIFIQFLSHVIAPFGSALSRLG